MVKAQKLPPTLKTRITKLFKQGVLLPDIKAEIEIKFPKINIQRIKTVLKAHFMGYCDELWSEAVKLKAGNLCAVDGIPGTLNSHHLIGRTNFKFRWEVDNGVCLSVYHHTLSHALAAHGSTNATQAFADWMINHRLGQWALFQGRRNDHVKIKVDVYFLLETARRLEAEIEALKNKPKVDIMARKKVGNSARERTDE